MRMNLPKELLFKDRRLDDFLEERKQEAKKEVQELDKETILKADLEELCSDLAESHLFTVPVISNHISVCEAEETTFTETNNDWEHADGSPAPETYQRTGIKIEFLVQFDGDSSFFDLCGCQPPNAQVVGNELELSYFRSGSNREGEMDQIKSEFDADLGRINGYLARSREKVDRYNQEITTIIRSTLKARKDALQEAHQSIASLGLPIRRRLDAPETYKPPVSRRKLPVRRAGTALRDAEPLPLNEEEYEHIIHVMFNMALVMERSPKAFTRMEEEDLRIHFLVQLNGQYEGQATGETFNLVGKTDILIRIDGQNIFIAECKYWDGRKTLIEAIDQLLTYLTFRDTKAAIVLFNRNKRPTNVLNQIPNVLENHPSFKEHLEYQRSGAFRCLLKHGGDTEYEVLLTILVFDIPILSDVDGLGSDVDKDAT